MSPKTRALILLLTITLIWGVSYPVARAAMQYMTPWAYGGFRFMFGALSLLPLALSRRRRPAPTAYAGNDSPRLWLWAGLLGGLCLSCGAVLQLYGLSRLPAGQVGFITTLYVSLVPVLAFVMGYLPRPLIVLGLGVGLFGLYLLAGGGGAEGLDKNAGLLVVADVFWAAQVIVTGYFAARVNAALFSLAQALTGACTLLGLAWFAGFLPDRGVFFQTLPYTMWGVLSVGVAYTCQTIAQKDISPTSAALIFPLQSVIGAAAGVIFLGETMTERLLVGAAVIILGTLIAQCSRESVRITPAHRWWRPIRRLRVGLGIALGLGTAGLLGWSLS